ncbi:hypothetical protein EAG_04091 [Camponotus floridanus]|uniref:Uncharacterized protein n=1 Tax=Camponotus floridanus TaxID=104421 RepID=E1ZV93_CAMFO|nr:hypothetical protein EAG_04091 [Camponotus floridanus]
MDRVCKEKLKEFHTRQQIEIDECLTKQKRLNCSSRYKNNTINMRRSCMIIERRLYFYMKIKSRT